DILKHHSNTFVQRIDEETKDNIIKDAANSPRQASTRKLGARHNTSHTSVHNILTEASFQFRMPEQKHVLTVEEMENRVSYCKDMLKYKSKKIKRCFFSDE